MHVVDIGDRISLVQIERHKVKISDKKYVSQLLDFVDSDKAIISVPMENGRIINAQVFTFVQQSTSQWSQNCAKRTTIHTRPYT